MSSTDHEPAPTAAELVAELHHRLVHSVLHRELLDLLLRARLVPVSRADLAAATASLEERMAGATDAETFVAEARAGLAPVPVFLGLVERPDGIPVVRVLGFLRTHLRAWMVTQRVDAEPEYRSLALPAQATVEDASLAALPFLLGRAS